jgi:hypothetical protein
MMKLPLEVERCPPPGGGVAILMTQQSGPKPIHSREDLVAGSEGEELGAPSMV